MQVLTHRSPGITAIFNAVKGANQNGILDLGTATGTNLSFYSQLGCRFQFESFDQAVTEFLAGELTESQVLDAFLSSLPSDKKFDVVLFWDLLNYLPKQLIEPVVEKLQSVLKPNALVHMVNFVGSTIPSHPAVFSVSDQYQLTVKTSTARIQPTQRVTTVALLKMFPRFLMVQSYLNGEGMASGFSEQILCFGATSQEKGSVFSSSETSSSVAKIGFRLNSPVVRRFISNADQANSMLDLGRKRGFNHDFWKRDYQTVVASELLPVILRYHQCSTQEKKEYLESGRFFNVDSSRTFDVIIAWDLLNYCDEVLLNAIGKRIAQHCHDGTKLVVMTYSGGEIPAKPQSFLVDQKGVGLAKSPVGQKLVKNPRRLTSTQIQKALPGFFVEQTFAFRPGMQKGLSEYLFVFKGEETLAREKEQLIAEVMARRVAKQGLDKNGE